eukprot:gene3115-8203_t
MGKKKSKNQSKTEASTKTGEKVNNGKKAASEDYHSSKNFEDHPPKRTKGHSPNQVIQQDQPNQEVFGGIHDSNISAQEHNSMGCGVYLLRHAERAENMEKSHLWKESGRAFDPPITSRGAEQALNAARYLQQQHEQSCFKRIFCSPLLRCIQTACIVGHHLGLPITIVKGLGACTRALRHKNIFDVPLASMEEAKRANAELVPFIGQPLPHITSLESDGTTSLEALLDCIAAAMGSDLLVCSHREIVRELLDDTSACLRPASRKQIGFCSIANFHFDETSASFEFRGVSNTLLSEERKVEKKKLKRLKRKQNKHEKGTVKSEQPDTSKVSEIVKGNQPDFVINSSHMISDGRNDGLSISSYSMDSDNESDADDPDSWPLLQKNGDIENPGDENDDDDYNHAGKDEKYVANDDSG